MKRADLLVLADTFAEMAKGTRCAVKYPGDALDRTAKELDAGAAILRQIAEAKPAAWMHDGFVSTNKERVEHDEMRNRSCGFKAKPIHDLYTLPLED